MFKIRIFQKNMTIICIYSVCVRAKTDFTEFQPHLVLLSY